MAKLRAAGLTARTARVAGRTAARSMLENGEDGLESVADVADDVVPARRGTTHDPFPRTCPNLELSREILKHIFAKP